MDKLLSTQSENRIFFYHCLIVKVHPEKRDPSDKQKSSSMQKEEDWFVTIYCLSCFALAYGRGLQQDNTIEIIVLNEENCKDKMLNRVYIPTNHRGQLILSPR